VIDTGRKLAGHRLRDRGLGQQARERNRSFTNRTAAMRLHSRARMRPPLRSEQAAGGAAYCGNILTTTSQRRDAIMSITPIEKVIYTAKAHTTGGRDGGASRTSDGHLDVKLSVPGTTGTGTNPEQLFAVGWSACYLSAMKLVAGRMKVKLPADVAIDPEVDLGTANGGYFLQARLTVLLPGLDAAIAQQLADEAHRECPYSKATHGNISVTTIVKTDAVAS
jgi:lipoyl-dependent peroxiredoxin